MGRTVPPNSYMEALSSKAAALKDDAFKELIKVKLASHGTMDAFKQQLEKLLI